MEQLSVWVGAGVVTVGVSAALLAGAGAASAETESGGSQSSASDGAGASNGAGASKPTKTVKTPKTQKTVKTAKAVKAATVGSTKPDATSTIPSASDAAVKPDPDATRLVADEPEPVTPDATPLDDAGPTLDRSPGLEPAAAPPSKPASTPVATPVGSVTSATPAVAARSSLAPPAPPSAIEVIQGVLGALVVNVGSLIFNTVQAVEALVTGPPQVPPGSTVTVRSSTVQLGNGLRVGTDWYYPKGDTVPERIILLQHGFFALGPMYSYTAANLAEKTNSIVVAPTLSSNPFAGDDNWLGGTGMSAAIADLFRGDRAALTQSAVDAGFATRYGPDAVLPQQFGLAGHSLGANLVSGAAGFLTEGCTAGAACAADDLVGVILLDGVPFGSTLPDALVKLNAYAQTTTGHYVPVREIGAPPNLYNQTSTVNADLAQYRSGRYNGVVLDGGVHSDPMRGGNPLIQLALYVAAGFPQPQNPPAVDALSVRWFNEWFAGDTAIGDDLVPGSAIIVDTAQGPARGIVIGVPPQSRATALRATEAFVASSPTAIPRRDPLLASIAA